MSAVRRRFCARVRLVRAFLLLGFVAVGVRVAQLQIYQHEKFAKLASDEYLREIQIPARRGHVYDRSGKPLAISVDVPSVYANPMAIPDARSVSRSLAPVLKLKVDTVYQRLASERMFVWLKRHVDPTTADEVRALNVRGIGMTKESRRFYPNRRSVLMWWGLRG